MSNQIDLNKLVQTANYAAQTARDAASTGQNHSKLLTEISQRQTELANALKMVAATRSGNAPPDIQRIENIPGRRIPFDMLCVLPINADVNSVQQDTILVSQEGPFVAVSRYATFLSQYQLQYQDPLSGAKAQFFGRSYGRWRPIHSAWDIMDGMPRQNTNAPISFPGTGAPSILSPSNGSPFRTMESDFLIQFLNAGSSFPRSNKAVPSSFWTTQINSAYDLGALDVFERGEQLQFQVQPTHINNPPFGNIQGFAGGGAGSFPFLASGWDYIEGINDVANPAAGSVDPVTRLPNGLLYIGFHGFRIQQPAGSGPY